MVSVLEPWQADSKIPASTKGQESTQLLNNNEVRELALLAIRTYCQVAVIEVVWC